DGLAHRAHSRHPEPHTGKRIHNQPRRTKLLNATPHLRQLRPEIVQYPLQRPLLRDLRLDALVHRIDHTDLPLRLKLLEIPAETEHVRSELLWRLLSPDIDTWLTVARSDLVQILAATQGLPTASPPSQ